MTTHKIIQRIGSVGLGLACLFVVANRPAAANPLFNLPTLPSIDSLLHLQTPAPSPVAAPVSSGTQQRESAAPSQSFGLVQPSNSRTLTHTAFPTRYTLSIIAKSTDAIFVKNHAYWGLGSFDLDNQGDVLIHASDGKALDDLHFLGNTNGLQRLFKADQALLGKTGVLLIRNLPDLDSHTESLNSISGSVYPFSSFTKIMTEGPAPNGNTILHVTMYLGKCSKSVIARGELYNPNSGTATHEFLFSVNGSRPEVQQDTPYEKYEQALLNETAARSHGQAAMTDYACNEAGQLIYNNPFHGLTTVAGREILAGGHTFDMNDYGDIASINLDVTNYRNAVMPPTNNHIGGVTRRKERLLDSLLKGLALTTPAGTGAFDPIRINDAGQIAFYVRYLAANGGRGSNGGGTNYAIVLATPSLKRTSVSQHHIALGIPGRITLIKATTLDSHSLSLSYNISKGRMPAVHLAVYRGDAAIVNNPTSGKLLGKLDILPQAGASENERSRLTLGSHQITLLPGIDLSPNTSKEYISVVATASGITSHTYFRKWMLGASSHGFDRGALIADGNAPYGSSLLFPSGYGLDAWQTQLHHSLVSIDKYDDVIDFNWKPICAIKAHGYAELAGQHLANLIRLWKTSHLHHAGDVLDLHLIGHSRGTVVVSRALLFLKLKSDEEFKGSFVELTLLDPHPANNHFGDWASSTEGILGVKAQVATEIQPTVEAFQAVAQDSPVEIVPGVQRIEIWWQHTDTRRLPYRPYQENLVNLWGIVPGDHGDEFSDGLINHSGLAYDLIDTVDLSNISVSQVLKNAVVTAPGRAESSVNYGVLPNRQVHASDLEVGPSLPSQEYAIGHSEVPLAYIAVEVNSGFLRDPGSKQIRLTSGSKSKSSSTPGAPTDNDVPSMP